LRCSKTCEPQTETGSWARIDRIASDFTNHFLPAGTAP